MFPTFSGNSRHRKQVNLSGRQNVNPFAQQSAIKGSQDVVADAQQNRLARQQERKRGQAAANIQRLWRGHAARKLLAYNARQEWDQAEQQGCATDEDASKTPYVSSQQAYERLSSLLRFYDYYGNDGSGHDLERLGRCQCRIAKTFEQGSDAYRGGPWPVLYLKMEKTCLNGLQRARKADTCSKYLAILRFAVGLIPALTTANSQQYYETMRLVVGNPGLHLIEHLSTPLYASAYGSDNSAYRNLARYVLTIPHLDSRLSNDQGLASLADHVGFAQLMETLATMLAEDENPATTVHQALPLQSRQNRSETVLSGEAVSWLLAHIIYLYRFNDKKVVSNPGATDHHYSFVVAKLLPLVADKGVARPPAHEFAGPSACSVAFPDFVDGQLSSLVNQESVSGLLAQIDIRTAIDSRLETSKLQVDLSKVLANYILTLLRLFPRRGDDIRMWLYLGSSRRTVLHGQKQPRSIIRFLWQGVQSTIIYSEVWRDPRAAVKFLKSDRLAMVAVRNGNLVHESKVGSIEDQWRLVLLFIELYSFVLKIMDDEEFFAQAQPISSADSSRSENNLGFDSIKFLTTFLKHLGFTMYYNASEIQGQHEDESSKSIGNLFKIGAAPSPHSVNQLEQTHICNLPGISLDYMKGAVTGLLRALYERDSRRPFLPKDHWLLTSRFDMTKFIDSVVEEEERRNQVQDAEDKVEEESDPEPMDLTRASGLVGTGHAQRQFKIDEMRRQQRKASRKRYLQAVAPRLEILQNMPFVIPFTTRVQIFRRFVHLDMIKRRNGTVDAELWRLSNHHGMDPFRHGQLERHHAKIRRGHEFSDAFDQYYQLGADLKEPISITFVDKFDQHEAGIDGGGVTKEFLTSVTSQAFGETEGVNLFIDNQKHLMFPNPSAIEEQKELLREAGLQESSTEFRATLTDLRQRYEFLGRIIGKCLYEGILVDIGFAPFFLLKWALTGGTGSAPRESGYRANLNDLRDFDQELYQGLIQLKNFTGDVEDTFSLNFTVTDTLTLPPIHPSTSIRIKTQTHDLIPSGTHTPVTSTNRLAYISHIARHRLSHQPYAQTHAFLRGLSALIPPTWLSMFNQSELQTLVGGAPAAISVPDLRANTVYGGVYTIGDDGLEHPSVRIFWEVMTQLEDQDRRKVLKFVTSTPRAPLLGFGSLMPRFSIRDSGSDETRLPSTSTCVNLLKLPRYSSVRGCREKLLTAVNSGAGFDLS